MSRKDDEEILKWVVVIIVFIGVVYFLTNIWFIIGILATLVVEGIIWVIYRIKWRTWQFWR